MALDCYLDDSADTNLPFITLAGFVAERQRWKKLEPCLDEIMNRYGVPVFHAMKFERNDGNFKEGWSGTKKLSFVTELAHAVDKQIAGASVTLWKEPINEWKKKVRELSSMSPLGVAFAGIILRIMTHSKLAAAARKSGLHFFIEQGNYSSELGQYFKMISDWPVFEGALRPPAKFVPKESSRAIQLADLYAFYSRRQMQNYDTFSQNEPRPSCRYIEILNKHVPLFQIATKKAPISLIGQISDFKNAPSMKAWYASLQSK